MNINTISLVGKANKDIAVVVALAIDTFQAWLWIWHDVKDE
jgi:hypothetical protein